MDDILRKLKDITSDCCVTILLNTHYTPEGNEQAEIALKNLIREAETRLVAQCGKPSSAIIDKLNELATQVDFREDSESLALFVNEEISQQVRLPVKVENRVIIDQTFATRDLMRALHEEPDYYILVISRDRARLIEASGARMIREIHHGFPRENSFPVPGGGSLMNSQMSLVLEFFDRVDRQLNELQKGKNLPVFICTEQSNFAEYLKMANHPERVAGLVPGNIDKQNARYITDQVWPAARKWNEEKKLRRLAELSSAVGSQNFLTDFTEIWRAIREGKGRTLFVKQGYFQPARLDDNNIQLVSPENSEEANVDDIIDEMIEKNLDHGGDIVFISGDELKDYGNLVLVTRY